MSNQQTVIVNVGVSGSGKTTWSTEYIKNNSNFMRINRDDLRRTIRGTLDGYYQNKYMNRVEMMINSLEEFLFVKFLSDGFSVIIDNTNLKPGYIQKWVDYVNTWNEMKTGVEGDIQIKFKLFPENNVSILTERVSKRDNLLHGSLEYIKKQVSSIRSAISYVEDNYKNQII